MVHENVYEFGGGAKEGKRCVMKAPIIRCTASIGGRQEGASPSPMGRSILQFTCDAVIRDEKTWCTAATVSLMWSDDMILLCWVAEDCIWWGLASLIQPDQLSTSCLLVVCRSNPHSHRSIILVCTFHVHSVCLSTVDHHLDYCNTMLPLRTRCLNAIFTSEYRWRQTLIKCCVLEANCLLIHCCLFASNACSHLTYCFHSYCIFPYSSLFNNTPFTSSSWQLLFIPWTYLYVNTNNGELLHDRIARCNVT